VSSTGNPIAAPVRALVRRYYLYAGLYTLAASLIWGINTLFLLDAGLSVAAVFWANAAFSLGTVLFEIPTGVVADTIGRRSSFLISTLVLGAGTLAYVGLARIGAGVVAFSAVSVLLGLGFTFYSGATEAWVVDGVRTLGHAGSLDRIFSTGQIVGGVAMLAGTIGGGFLGQVDLALPFLLRSVLLFALFVLAARGMRDVGFEARPLAWRTLPAEANALATAGIRHGWSSRPLRGLMVAGAVQGGFFAWAWYAWQPYFLELLGRDAIWVAGVVAAALSLAMMAGNGIVRFVTRFCGRRSTILLATGTVFTLASIGVGLSSDFAVAFGLLLVAAVTRGVQAPVRQAFVHELVPSAERATVVSFDSMIGGVGSFAGQGGLGSFSDATSYSAGYVVGGTVAAVAIPIVWWVQRLHAAGDAYEGTGVAEPGSCVPRGLPEVAGVEGRSRPDAAPAR